MAKLFDRVVPQATAKQHNNVTSLPDVQNTPDNTTVFHLYRLGILTGNDKYGTSNPYRVIKRSETAAIINRVLNPDNRKTFTLTPTSDPQKPDHSTDYSATYQEMLSILSEADPEAELGNVLIPELEKAFRDLKNGKTSDSFVLCQETLDLLRSGGADDIIADMRAALYDYYGSQP